MSDQGNETPQSRGRVSEPSAEPKQRDVDPYDYESIFTEDSNAAPAKTAFRIPTARLKKGLIPLILVLVLIVGVLYAKSQTNPGTARGAEILVEVPKGASFSSVSNDLEAKNIIPNAFFFGLYAKINGGVPVVQAGEYSFHVNDGARNALAVLNAGPKAVTDRLVIPEGYRLNQIAVRVGQLPRMSGEKFLELAKSGKYRSEYEPAGVNNLEGLLFPDTYLISSSDTEETLLKRMIGEFENQAKIIGLDNSLAAVGHDPYETVIIASMIEAEAKIPDDRGKISQVIENRLFKAMPLQIDATVLYGLGNTKQSLSSSDLKVDTPFNTYLHNGLPPAPICNPGAAALKAALQPTPGPWLYYVVTGTDGSHSFATTLDEHNANIALAKKRGVL